MTQIWVHTQERREEPPLSTAAVQTRPSKAERTRRQILAAAEARFSTNGFAKTRLDVADHGSFGHDLERQDIADRQSGLLAAINELSGIHAFGAHKELIVTLVLVRVAKLNLANGGTATRVVHNFLHHAANVTVLFGIVQSAKLDGSLARARVSLENRALTATLSLS